MEIYVVWSPDGDVYYNKGRNAYLEHATDFAYDMVNTHGQEKFDEVDIKVARIHHKNQDWPSLRNRLFQMGAIKTCPLRE